MFRMNHLGFCLLALTLALGTPPAVSHAAADKPAKKKAAKPGKGKSASVRKNARPQGYWAIVGKSLDLSASQKPKYDEAVIAASAASKAWEKENESKIDAIKAAAKKAKEDKDKDAAKKAREDMKALTKELDAIKDKHRGAIMAILTDTQKDKLAGYGLYMGAARKYSKAKLSDAQKDKLKALAMASGADARAAGDDKKKRAAVLDALYAKADGILTSEQKEALTKPTKSKPSKSKAKDAK